MTMEHYILESDHSIRIEPDLLTWARWLETDAHRRVAKTDIGAVRVSTVFLGLDHNWRSTGPPILFETMIFGLPGTDREYCERCATWDEAVAMHAEAVRFAHQALAPHHETH